MIKRLIVLGFLLMVSARAAGEARSNILFFFFFVDDWGRYAGAYSDPKQPSLNDIVKTPNIDRIGREGVVFNNAFVPVSSCSPSRASLTTGRYFWKCGSGALSVRAPLLVRWPAAVKAGRHVDDFINLMDIGPTLLEAAGLQVPAGMDGRSFLPQLNSAESGWIDPRRDSVVVGRELHFYSARDGNLPYPMRAIRTKDLLYIRNFKPDRWPSGAPYHLDDPAATADYERLNSAPYRDLDASLTKSWLLGNRAAPEAAGSIALTLGKRPREELYSVRDDPDSLHNLASDPAAGAVKDALSARLTAVLEKSGDPRLTDAFDKPPYVVETPAVGE